MKYEAVGLTDRGLRRHHNEDAFLIREDLGLLVVADGMGGHAAGEVAADLAVRELERVVAGFAGSAGNSRSPDWDESRGRSANLLSSAIVSAHRRVTSAVEGNLGLRGMGATVVAALLATDTGTLTLAHVGDSRAYIFREGKLGLLTSDHSWVHEQVVAGLLSEDAARTHPLKNVVTRALGGTQEPAVDLRDEQLQVNDLLLLCSDGLNTMLEDDEIAKLLLKAKGLKASANDLVHEANRRGGLDNITVILARVVG